MINLNYIMFANHSGYSQAAQDSVMSLLNDDNINLKITAIGNKISNRGISDSRYKILKSLYNKELEKDSINIFHCVPNLQRNEKVISGQKNIGFATFETFDPPESPGMNWISILNRNDGVIVPSKFNLKIFSEANVKKPIFYIPHCIDTELYNPSIKVTHKYNKFTFLFFGSWKMRKGYPQLLEAWMSEFNKEDNVQLIIKTDHARVAQSNIETLKKNMGFSKKKCADITFENTIFDECSLPGFLKSVNCLVSPTCGEGFGLPGMQSLAVGTPIAITDFSGCQDYANSETAYMLEPDDFIKHKCMDRYPQFANKRWAYVSVDKIRKALRYIYENYGEMKNIAENGSEFVRSSFNYENNRILFRELLETVSAEVLS